MMEFKPIQNFRLSRKHIGGNNFLTITQYLVIKYNYNTATEYCPVDGLKVLKPYEMEGIKEDNSATAREELLDYLKNDCMDPKNVATSSYKYFMIIFANGRRIIATDFDDFLVHLKEMEARFSK